jgi:glycosyltransferase involved in cell wall biosynthesis
LGGGALREFYAARRLSREGVVPVCATIHDPPRPVWWPLHSSAVRRNRVIAAGVREATAPLARRLESSVMHSLDALFVLTHAGAASMRSKYQLTDAQLLRTLSYPTASTGSDVPPNLASARRGLTVGFFGYWYPGKGLEVLIDAISLLRDADPPIHAKLWGDISSLAGHRQGNHYREVVLNHLRHADLGNRVEVLGYLDGAEVRPRLRECDVVVLPYITSPVVAELRSTSASMFEALTAHTPVIASDVKALNEMIVDGVNGFLVEPGNAGALASCLRDLCSDSALRLRLRDGARNSVRELSLRRTAMEAHETYDQVLRRRAVLSAPRAGSLLSA